MKTARANRSQRGRRNNILDVYFRTDKQQILTTIIISDGKINAKDYGGTPGGGGHGIKEYF